eukprot:c9116_g1_i1.p1 GENE.c9116_g1_i1~~c9116_g1_i1.p1  ORF type:complete len:425 (-),score=90.26 c9116_g1_i1:47-1321(-)
MGVGGDGKFVPALANFHVQYNFQSIAIAIIVMKTVYPEPTWEGSVLSSVVFAGAITGQIIFGYIGDVMGRNRAMVLTNFMTVIGALGSALFGWGSGKVIYITIIVCRFFLGVGVGGVYPLSAARAAESCALDSLAARSRSVSWAFFWQTPGSMAPFVVAIIVQALFHSPGLKFRLILGLGALPALVCLLSSLKGKESQEFQESKKHPHPGVLWRKDLWFKLIGTGGSWLLYDVCYYGTALFAPNIIDSIFGDDEDVIERSWQTVVSNAMGIPGVLLTIFLFRYFSTKQLQIIGFIAIAACYLILALAEHLDKDNHSLVFSCFCLLICALNFGPNVTTFTLPQEIFAADVRTTFNGISAALAKVGALIGAYMYEPINDSLGLPLTMCICAGISLLGAVLTYFFVEDVSKRRSQINTNLLNESTYK